MVGSGAHGNVGVHPSLSLPDLSSKIHHHHHLKGPRGAPIARERTMHGWLLRTGWPPCPPCSASAASSAARRRTGHGTQRLGAAGDFVLTTFDPNHCAATCSCGYDQRRPTTGEADSGSTVLQLAAVQGRAACSGRALGRRCGFSKLEGFALFTFSSQGAQRWKL